MDFSKFNFEPLNVLKFVTFALLGLIVVVFAGGLILSSFQTSRGGMGFAPSGAVTESVSMMDGDYGMGMNSAQDMPKLGLRNIAPMPPSPGGAPGNDAESYEIAEHSASIEAHNKYDACKTIADLKAHEHVIFENANESKRNCSFSFKVEHSHVDEVLGVIKGLNPKDMSDSTYTIKQQVNDYTNQIQILEAKRASIDDTLTKALIAYDEVTKIATASRDAMSLATIIDSKVGVIERLTQERININMMLEQLSRSKAEQLDRLTYTYFNVSIYESRYVDFEALKQSWKASIQDFIQNVNWALQSATVYFVQTIVMLIPFILYAFLALLAVKYGWRIGKRIWQN